MQRMKLRGSKWLIIYLLIRLTKPYSAFHTRKYFAYHHDLSLRFASGPVYRNFCPCFVRRERSAALKCGFSFCCLPRLLRTHVTHPLNDQDLRAQPDFRSQYGSFCCSSPVTATLFLPSITLRVTQFFNTLQRDICRKTACRKPLL